MVYFDYNATTPVDRRVLDAMMPAFDETFNNPSSESHDTDIATMELVRNARRQMAEIVGMNQADVVFTSGATEANNVFYGLCGVASRIALRWSGPPPLVEIYFLLSQSH